MGRDDVMCLNINRIRDGVEVEISADTCVLGCCHHILRHFLPMGSALSSVDLGKMERVMCVRDLLTLGLQSRCVGRRRSTYLWHDMLLGHPVESCKLAHGIRFAW